jgi:hypothetical protein
VAAPRPSSSSPIRGESGGTVAVLGPVTHESPVRLVDATALSDLLRRASTLASLQSVRDLAEQLDHLDKTGVE